jgi:hypothetical protein
MRWVTTKKSQRKKGRTGLIIEVKIDEISVDFQEGFKENSRGND